MEDMGIDRVVLVPDSPDRVDLRQFNVERSGNQSNLSVYGSSLRGNRNNDRRHWHDQRNPMDVDGHEPQDRSGTFLSFEHTHPSQDRPFVRKAPMINNFNRESGPSTERQHVDKGNRSIEQDDLNSIFDMAFPRGASRNYAEERKGQTSPSNRGCLSHSNPISSRRSSSSYKGKDKIDCSGSNGSGLAINARNVIDLSCGSPDENIELVPMAHVPANLPRVPGQRRLVRNGCISPIYIASQFRTSSEGEHVGSSFVEKGQGEDMISDSQLQADIEEIVEESNDGRKGKGKEVLTNPPTLHKRTADAKYASTSNPVSSENMANQVNGACVQPPGNWRTTRSHARKNVQPLADPAAASFVGEQHEKRASLRDNANGTFANCPCASNYVTTRSKSRNSSGLNRTSEPYPKRQKTHGPTLEINHSTLPANDDVEVLFLGSGQELSSSRPSSLHSNQYERVSRGLNTSYQVDSTSSGIRLSGLQVTDHVDNDDSYARARQVEEDEKLACEIQEQLYFGADESNTDTTSALQQEEYSYEHLFDDAMISTSTLQQEEYSYELLLDDAMISRANEIDEDAALGLEEFGLQNHSRSFNVNSSTLRPSRQGRSQSSSSRRANQAQAPTTRASQLRTRPSSRQRRRFVRAPITRTSRLRTGMFNQPSASTSRVSHRFYPANILMHLEMGIDMFEELEAAVDNEMSAHFTLSNFLDDPLDFHDDFEMWLALNEDNHRHNEDNHQHGVSIDRINSLPESVIQIENSEEICAICLESPATGETIRHLPCLHKFHKDCIDPWLTRKTTCPMCKSSIT